MTGHPHYKTSQWTRLRHVILTRDGFRCRLRLGPFCLGEANAVDHIVPRSKGGSDSPENLISACRPCNSHKKDTMVGPVHSVPW
jgi:5-methylcytosine-specific restriction endonuclease McrA